MDKDKLDKVLKLMPSKPGVYIMKNRAGEIIYIGKSRALKKRVSSYFRRKHHNVKTSIMVSAIENIEFIITNNEVEALILENNLIKKHKPRYNVLLKDSKTHPYVRVTLKEEYPRIEKVRRVSFHDGNLYFGPFPNAYDLNHILDLITRTCRLCTSKTKIGGKKKRPCLKYHLHLCQGACQGEISPEAYKKSIQKAIDLLSGKTAPDFKEMEEQLQFLKSEYRYEEAAELRDTITALHRFFEDQKVEFVKPVDSDIWGSSQSLERIVFSVFFVRGGKLLGNRVIDVEPEPEIETAEILTSLMTRFYDRNLIPPLIYCSLMPDSDKSLKKLLEERIGRKVKVAVPSRGKFRHLLKMADTNALEVLKNLSTTGNEKLSDGVIDLQNRLNLKNPPKRIECIDISHIQGVDPVASLVVTVNGKPAKKEYRLFHIKTASGGDDPASIAEVVRRRLTRRLKEKQPLPDLLIVDGGIAQVRAAENEMHNLSLDFPLLGLAKREELLVSSDGKERKLPFSSPGMKIIIKLRNESHRFANSFQKKTHSKRMVRSALLNLPGVGPAILRKILRVFKSTAKVKQKTPEELQKMTGIPFKTAKIIIKALNNEK